MSGTHAVITSKITRRNVLRAHTLRRLVSRADGAVNGSAAQPRRLAVLASAGEQGLTREKGCWRIRGRKPRRSRLGGD
jgi:hypothetical protein